MDFMNSLSPLLTFCANACQERGLPNLRGYFIEVLGWEIHVMNQSVLRLCLSKANRDAKFQGIRHPFFYALSISPTDQLGEHPILTKKRPHLGCDFKGIEKNPGGCVDPRPIERKESGFGPRGEFNLPLFQWLMD